jgi:hypothetical protein
MANSIIEHMAIRKHVTSPPVPPYVDNTDQLAYIYSTAASHGVPNYKGARINVQHALNLPAWDRLLNMANFKDPRLIQFLSHGFPLGYSGPSVLPNKVTDNHTSALKFPVHMDKYILSERSAGCIAGPIDPTRFPPLHFNAMMSRPKGESDRRIIMDLSYPESYAVNDFIDRSSYEGEEAVVTLPTPGELRNKIIEQGKGAFIYILDLKGSYRQLQIDPCDWPMTGIIHHGLQYFDMVLPFGAP